MLERIWTSLLELTAQFVTPDWGAIIGAHPGRLPGHRRGRPAGGSSDGSRKAPPARRGKQRIEPRDAGRDPHARTVVRAGLRGGRHVPALPRPRLRRGRPSSSGVIALSLTLLYWLAEGLRIYDHDIGVDTVTTLPAVVQTDRRPASTCPDRRGGRSSGAFGVFPLFLGLVFGGWLLTAGVIALIATLVGWLADAVKEYREDGRGGHDRPPREPADVAGRRRCCSASLVVLILGAAVLQLSAFAIGEANGGDGARRIGCAGRPPRRPASGGASGAPPPSGGGAAADVDVQAKDVQFVEKTLTAPAGKPFTIAFANEDPGTPHNIEHEGRVRRRRSSRATIFNGVETKVYDVPALPAGAYTFVCTVHPSMTGTATLQ